MAVKNYPHPVLSPRTADFKDDLARFDIKISHTIEGMNYKLNCDVDLTEENLINLLNEEKIKFVVQIKCSFTRYRQVFEFHTLQETLTLPASSIDKKVEIATYIVAKQTIESYSSIAFDEDYEDTVFNILEGDILAEGSVYSLKIKKQIDPLTTIPSIFTIIVNSNKKAPSIDVNSLGDKIVITLDTHSFEKYKSLKQLQNQYGYLAALTSSLFITPALVNVLDNIRKDLESLNGNTEAINDYIEEKEVGQRWFKVINMKLKDLKIDLHEPEEILDSSLLIAQKLLGEPLSNGLKFFNELFNNAGEVEEFEA